MSASPTVSEMASYLEDIKKSYKNFVTSTCIDTVHLREDLFSEWILPRDLNQNNVAVDKPLCGKQVRLRLPLEEARPTVTDQLQEQVTRSAS